MVGWIKLYRNIQESTEWKTLTNEGRLVMIALLLNCNYRESEVIIEGKLRTIAPGQWLTSIPKIKEIARVTDQNVRTALRILKTSNFLTDEVTDGNHRIITIKEWFLYQDGNGVTDEVTDGQQTPNRRLTDGVTESKEGLRIKEGKEGKNNTLPPNPGGEILLEIFDYWNSLEIIPHRKLTENMKRAIKGKLEDYTPDEIKAAIRNYAEITKSDKYWISTRHGLDVFLRQNKNGFPEFLDSANPHQNYKRFEKPDLLKEFMENA